MKGFIPQYVFFAYCLPQTSFYHPIAVMGFKAFFAVQSHFGRVKPLEPLNPFQNNFKAIFLKNSFLYSAFWKLKNSLVNFEMKELSL